MENRLRQNIEEVQDARVKKGKVSSFASKYLDFSGLITKEMVIEQIPFVFFLALLAIVYISNTYYTEKIIRQIDKNMVDLKELRSEYITSKSDLMFRSKQSEVARATEVMGLKESVVPPKIIALVKEVKSE